MKRNTNKMEDGEEEKKEMQDEDRVEEYLASMVAICTSALATIPLSQKTPFPHGQRTHNTD